MAKRVTAGKWYRYTAAHLMDRVIHPPDNLQPGDLVQVKNLTGCPPCNTMGMAHVVHPDGTLGGLVYTASLEPARAPQKENAA